MVKNLVNDMRYYIYTRSVIWKILFLLYMMFLSVIIYDKGLESTYGNMVFLVWTPSMFGYGQENLFDIERLLPIDEWELKVTIVCRNVVFGLITSFISALTTIPRIIKGDRPIIFIKLLLITLLCSCVFNSCKFKYKKKNYPGWILWASQSLISLIMIMLMVAEVEPYSILLDIFLCVLSVAVVALFTGIRLFIIRKIPISEISCDTYSEKEGEIS